MEETNAIRAREAVIQDEFERLRSLVFLEKDRYRLAASLVKQLRTNRAAISFDLEEELPPTPVSVLAAAVPDAKEEDAAVRRKLSI